MKLFPLPRNTAASASFRHPRRLAGEIIPDLGRDEPRGLRLRHDLLHHIVAVEVAGATEKRLETVVVKERAVNEFFGQAIQRPTGQGAGGFGDILFGVMAFAEGKKFHVLAREILVRMRLAALRLVEPDQHRRILAGVREQFQPVARGELAEQFVLPPHVIGVAHLFKAGGKMPVPEQHHLFLKRPGAFGHAIQPPAAQFHEALELKLLLLLKICRRSSGVAFWAASRRR